jgi:cold-inducible RNA-binding protein
VGNLNYRTTKEDLVEFLSPAGEVVDAFLPTDRETGRPRGFGFVTFASEDQARACIEQFDGKELGGRPLNINPAEERRRGSGPGRGGSSRDKGRGRGRPSPIAEFKRGSGPSDGPPPRRAPAPAPGAPAAAVPAEEEVALARDQEERKFHAEPDDWDDEPHWKKKKKKRKGSRRGLRAKKRSL